MMSSKENPASTVKILVLSKDGQASEKMRARLESLPTIVEIQFLKESSDTKLTASAINKGNYDVVLIDENITSPWEIIHSCSELSQRTPKFYLDGSVDKLLNDEITRANFSGAVEVVKSGNILLRQSYGETNKTNHIPNTLNTRFSTGSIGKMFTAVAVANMVEEFGLDYHKPIRDYLPHDYPHKEIFQNFTLHELLTHTSGLRGGIQEPFFKAAMTHFDKLDDLLPWIQSSEFTQDKDIATRRAKHEHVYSNPGFFLLGFAIEAIIKQNEKYKNTSYYDYVRDKVFLPAGMANTVRQRNADVPFAIPHLQPPVHTYSTEWLNDNDLIQNEKDETLNELILSAQSLVKQSQQCIKKFHPKVQALMQEYESGLARLPLHDEEKFLAFRTDFIKKLEKICNDAELENYNEAAKQVEANYKKLTRWIESHSNHPSINTAKKLLELFGFRALYQDFNWPLEGLGLFLNNLSISHPAGCWYLPLADLHAFHEALWNPNGPLSKYREVLTNKNVIVYTDETKKNKYGYGISIRNINGDEAIGHFGGVPGASASFYFYPKEGMSLITFCNDESVKTNVHFAIENNLIFGEHHHIQYFDPKININAEASLIQNIHDISSAKAELEILNERSKCATQTFFKSSLQHMMAENNFMISESWFEQELAEKREILQAFWQQRMMQLDQKSVDEFKKNIIDFHFPRSKEWEQKITHLFSDAIERKIDFEQFFNELKYLPMVQIRGGTHSDKLNLPEKKELEQKSEIDGNDIINIKRYMVEKGITGSVSFGFANQAIITPEYSADSKCSYAMHSVGKVFTGMLTLVMVRENLLSEKDLTKPLDKDFIESLALPESVKKHLIDNKITLHQLMTHKAGLGDYLGDYCKAISDGHVPKIERPEDFLKFAESTTYSVGENRYSNLGILLVGLAVKHAYEKKHGPSEYDEILKKYILDQVGMPSFLSNKPEKNAKYNLQEPDAAHIAGSPAGGYWITSEDLAKFGQWIYKSCQNDPKLLDLIKEYGQEFYNEKHNMISHGGAIPSSSAFLSVSLTTGAVIATLSDQSDMAFELNSMIQSHVFSSNKSSLQEENEISYKKY